MRAKLNLFIEVNELCLDDFLGSFSDSHGLGYWSLVRVTEPGLVNDRIMGTYLFDSVEDPGVFRTQRPSRLFE